MNVIVFTLIFLFVYGPEKGWAGQGVGGVLVCVFIIVFVCKYVFSVTCIVAAFVLSFFAHILVKK